MSHVMCHMSRVTCHMSRVRFIFIFYYYYFFVGHSGQASQGRVCYQRGLPRLVSSKSAKSVDESTEGNSNNVVTNSAEEVDDDANEKVENVIAEKSPAVKATEEVAAAIHESEKSEAEEFTVFDLNKIIVAKINKPEKELQQQTKYTTENPEKLVQLYNI